MKTSEVLQRARALIADERRWCQGVEAKDADGAPVAPWNAELATVAEADAKLCFASNALAAKVHHCRCHCSNCGCQACTA